MRSKKILFFVLAILIAGLTFAAEALKPDREITLEVIRQIRHDIVRNMVFDNLNVETHDGNVILTGKMRNGVVMEQAVKAAGEVPGVRSVTNRIQLLPASIQDDRLRLRIYQRLRTDNRLFMYFTGIQPSVNIILSNGRVTLTGMVNSDVARAVIGSSVREMPGVLSVDNKIQID